MAEDPQILCKAEEVSNFLKEYEMRNKRLEAYAHWKTEGFSGSTLYIYCDNSRIQFDGNAVEKEKWVDEQIEHEDSKCKSIKKRLAQLINPNIT